MLRSLGRLKNKVANKRKYVAISSDSSTNNKQNKTFLYGKKGHLKKIAGFTSN